MKCANCGRVLPAGSWTCAECHAPRAAVEPAFAGVEEAYVRLREQYDSGAISAETFKAQVEAQRLERDGRWWMLGVKSGQWYVHDGTSWREQDPPLAAIRTDQAEKDGEIPARGPTADAPSPSAAAQTGLPKAQAPAGRLHLGRRAIWLVGLLVLAAAAAYAVVSRLPSHDPVVAALINTPLPETAYSAKDFGKPELWKKGKDWAPGQFARLVFPQRDIHGGAYMFDVFRGAGAAQKSYDESARSDRAGAAQVASQGIDVYDIPNLNGVCTSGNGKAGVCRALAGRTVVTVIFKSGGEPDAEANQSAQALVNHVLSLTK